MFYRATLVLHDPSKDILEEIGPEVSNVCEVVNRKTARIQSNPAFPARADLLYFPSQRIEDTEAHGCTPFITTGIWV